MSFLFRRLIGLLTTLLAVALAVFVVMDLLPGDPAAVILGTEARPDTLAALRADLGLDRPAAQRLLDWLGGMLRGEFGESIAWRVPVAELIGERLVVTLPLAALAMLIAITLAIPLGLLAAVRAGGWGDVGTGLFVQIGIAIPNFWFGLLFVLLFASTLGWLPAGGFPGWEAGWGPGLRALLLPALSLALPQAAVLTRVVRAAVLEVLDEDFVRTARAKGLPERVVLWRHVLPNAAIPVVTILGMQISFLIAGAVLVETVFTLPGLGRLLVQALGQRDLVTLRTLALLLAALVVIVNFLVDLAYARLDPRLRT